MEPRAAHALRRRRGVRLAVAGTRARAEALGERVAATRSAPSAPTMAGRTARPGGAVVLGGDYRALGVVRSLGRRGVPVWVVREGDDTLAAVSRYASRRLPWPIADERAQ